MGTFELLSILLTLAALFSFASRGLLGLPATAGVFLLAFGFAFATAVVGTLVPAIDIRVWEDRLVTSTHLPEALLEGVLAFLLFAGAVEQDSGTLWRRRWSVALLATLGVVISTAVMGTGMWMVFDAMGQPVPLLWCLVLGAALAPTDPVAVLAVLRKAPLPEGLRTAIAGESLFNDGMGVVLFVLLLGLATGTDTDVTVLGVAWDIVREAGGGGLLGLATGSLAFWAKSRADDPAVELAISLALAAATYSLAQRLGLSGPIAVVMAGLLIGNTAKHHVSSCLVGAVGLHPEGLLVDGGRDPERRAVHAGRSGGRGGAVLAGAGDGCGGPGASAGAGGPAGQHPARGRRPSAQPAQGGGDRRADLGRGARRHRRGAGSVAPRQPAPRPAAGRLLRRRRLHHHRAEPDARPAGAAPLS